MLASFKGHPNITKNYSVGRKHAWCTITSLVSVFFILLFSPSPSLGISPESEIEMMSLSTTTENQKNEEQQQEYRLIPVEDQIPAQGNRPVKFQEQCKYMNDPKTAMTVAHVCVKVFDNPTEAYVKIVTGDQIYLKNGPFPIGENGQKFEGYFPGLATRSFYLYVILEPNNNYVAWKFLDVCTPENPNCNDNKQPTRLITFAGPNEPLDDVTPPPIPEPRFPQKCAPYELSTPENPKFAYTDSGRICAEVPGNADYANVQVWLSDDKIFDGQIPNGQAKVVHTSRVGNGGAFQVDLLVNAILEPDKNYIGMYLKYPCGEKIGDLIIPCKVYAPGASKFTKVITFP
jgi:hypothetical protein